MPIHLVLYHPAIPQNTGNIARTTVGFNAHLHLVKPYKFEITDHAVQRAGLDYWPHVKLTEHDNDDAFLSWLNGRTPWLVTKFGETRFDLPAYQSDDVLILGNENSGLPDTWMDRWQDRQINIPILGNIRSYNLANAAAILLAHASLKAGVFER